MTALFSFILHCPWDTYDSSVWNLREGRVWWKLLYLSFQASVIIFLLDCEISWYLQYDCNPYATVSVFYFSPHLRMNFSCSCNIWLFYVRYKNAFMLVCLGLTSSVKSLKLYVNFTGLPCYRKFHFLSFTLIPVVMLLSFKQL